MGRRGQGSVAQCEIDREDRIGRSGLQGVHAK